MLDSAKARLRRTKEFARQHQTALACMASAATASAITWRFADNVMNHTFQSRFQALLLREALLRDFVSEKDLKKEFLTEFIPSLQ